MTNPLGLVLPRSLGKSAVGNGRLGLSRLKPVSSGGGHATAFAFRMRVWLANKDNTRGASGGVERLSHDLFGVREVCPAQAWFKRQPDVKFFEMACRQFASQAHLIGVALPPAQAAHSPQRCEACSSGHLNHSSARRQLLRAMRVLASGLLHALRRASGLSRTFFRERPVMLPVPAQYPQAIRCRLHPHGAWTWRLSRCRYYCADRTLVCS